VSSNRFSSTLQPDPWLRILVLTSGRLLLAAGLILILVMEVSVALRALAGLIWTASGYHELRSLQAGFDNLRAIRLFSDGAVEVLGNEQEWVPAEVQTGCIVLQNLAWLRLRAANGAQFVELLRGDTRRSQNWRRLQVIWRHVGAGL